MLRTRVGKDYVPETLQEDVRSLFATKQFGNVSANTAEDGPGKVRVILYIRDYPNQIKAVTYQGNVHLSNDELGDLDIGSTVFVDLRRSKAFREAQPEESSNPVGALAE